MTRDQLREQTFGEKLSPVLKEIEDAIWQHEIEFEDEPPHYTLDGFRAAAKIFMSALTDKLWANDTLLGCPIEYMERRAEALRNDIRRLVKEYTNIDTHNLYKHHE